MNTVRIFRTSAVCSPFVVLLAVMVAL